MVNRENERPTCAKCGKKISGWYANRPGFVGDTFLGWDYEGHKCRLGIKYFIERMDIHQWWMGPGTWTNDPMSARMFDTRVLAEEYLKMSTLIPPRLECQVTEHEFVD